MPRLKPVGHQLSGRRYILTAPVDLVGLLAVDATGLPVEVAKLDGPSVVLRQPTAEPEVMPQIAEAQQDWNPEP